MKFEDSRQPRASLSLCLLHSLCQGNKRFTVQVLKHLQRQAASWHISGQLQEAQAQVGQACPHHAPLLALITATVHTSASEGWNAAVRIPELCLKSCLHLVPATAA